MPAARFKEQCLALLDDPGPDGIVITKHGRPVARLVRYVVEPSAKIGSLGGQLELSGDLMSTGARWDAES